SRSRRRSPTRLACSGSVTTSAALPWPSTRGWVPGTAGPRSPSPRARDWRWYVLPQEADLDRGLVIGGERLRSRLFLGSSGFGTLEGFERALDASGAELVTVALRRVEQAAGGLYDVIERHGCRVLPNTAGGFTARDAGAAARRARGGLGRGWGEAAA